MLRRLAKRGEDPASLSFRRKLIRIMTWVFAGIAVLAVASNLVAGVVGMMSLITLGVALVLCSLCGAAQRALIPDDFLAACLMTLGGGIIISSWFAFGGVLGSSPELLFLLLCGTLLFSTRQRQLVVLLFVLVLAALLYGAHLLVPEWLAPYEPTLHSQLVDLSLTGFLALNACGMLILKLSWQHIRALHQLQLEHQAVIALERERAERAERELQERQELVGRLGMGLAHDLQNMLGVVIMSAQLLEEEDDPEARQAIIESAQMASRIAGRFRKLTVAESATLAELDLHALLSALALPIRHLSPQVHLELKLPDGPVWVWLPQIELEQVVMNLCLNAVQAMPDGGVLRVGCVTQQNGMALLSVSDTGAGMSSALQKRIFEPFYTTKHDRGGTGIGLSTVQRIVERWSGQIHVESVPGTGTCFSIQFPTGLQALVQSVSA